MEEIRSAQRAIFGSPDALRTEAEKPNSAKIKSVIIKNEKETENVSSLSIAIREKPVSFEQAVDVSRSLEGILNESNTEVQFGVITEREGSNRINFKIVDKKTGEVVREFPSEEVVKMADKALKDSRQGILINSEV